jgi:lipopolysaccharide biosynthesis glycosyltransferase
MNNMYVVFCLDNNYVMQYCVTMTSLCENNSNCVIEFYIITDKNFTYKNEIILIKIANKYGHSLKIFRVDITTMLNYPPFNNSIATYYRLLIADILPINIDKVLYLDGDLIVRSQLQDLWENDINGYSGGAILENREENNNQTDNYFSSGVMLINLKYWRENNIGGRTQNFIHKFPEKCKIVDQDALNYILKNNIKCLPFKYNIMCFAYHKDEFIKIKGLKLNELHMARLNPVILHFNEPRKPWNYGCTMMYKEEFFRYLEKTEWKDFKIKFDSKIFIRSILRKIAQYINLFPRLINIGSFPKYLKEN